MPARSRMLRMNNELLVVVLTFFFCLTAAATATAAPSSVPHERRQRCRGVSVVPGDDIQEMIDRHPDHTTFCFRSGVYMLSATIWTGSKHPRLDLRSGAVLDGQNGTFVGISGESSARDRPGTVVLGGIFQHFGNSDEAVSPIVMSGNWVVRGTEFRENFNTGLTILGDNARVTNVSTHHNGRYGLVVTHACVGCPGPTGVIIEDTEIAFNNTRQLDTDDDAGGTKFSAGTNGMVVRRNEIHDNYGSGIWFDTGHTSARIYGNVIYDNHRWGIFWEASYGGAKIHDNRLRHNGVGGGTSSAHNAQILVLDSDGGDRGIEIFENTISGAGTPIALIDVADRSTPTTSVYVHHNVMTLRADESQVGAFGIDLFSPEANNHFDYNTYRVPDRRGSHWAWNGQTLTWRGWRNAGHDRNGRLRVLG